MTMRKKTRGGKAATERIEVRVTKTECAAMEYAAALAGMSLSEWIRRRCESVYCPVCCP